MISAIEVELSVNIEENEELMSADSPVSAASKGATAVLVPS